MFKCKVCLEKDAHIRDLKTEINYLRALYAPPADRALEPLREADAILSGRSHTLVLASPEEQSTEPNDTNDEAARILSGNY